MNIRELYENGLLDEAARRLQGPRIEEKSEMEFMTEVMGPEVMPDSFLRDWLVLNYLYTVDFKPDGTLIMGEIGGPMPTHSEDGSYMLAFSVPSMERVLYATGLLKKTDDKTTLKAMEERVERPFIYRDGMIIIDGNVNIAHYDFTTMAAVENPFDLIRPDFYLILFARGVTVLSTKCLYGEHFIFNIPKNPALFDRMRGITGEGEYERRLEMLKGMGNGIVPEGFIAGMRMKYKGNRAALTPIIGEREMETHSGYFMERGYDHSESNIGIIGAYKPDGSIGIWEC